MKYRYLALVMGLFMTMCMTSQVYRTQTLNSQIKTLQLKVAGSADVERPIIELNSSEVYEISFDELSHESHTYTYTVYHCNADWTMSDLNSNEYLQGFTTLDIDDYEYSLNTQQLYTHYRFSLPNDDMRLKLSGNYAVRIYEDGDMEKTVAWVCLSLVEPQVGISHVVRSNTDIELNKRFQQLDFDVNLKGYNVRDAFSELTILVRQNNRLDNEVYVTKPTFVESNRLRYMNNKNLIFEGGNEYRTVDILSEYILGTGVEKVSFDRTYYHAMLTPAEAMTNSYVTAYDVNGQMVVNRDGSDDSDVEADYMWVHFTFPMQQPFFDGMLYVGGDLNYNLLDKNSRMTYDNETRQYVYAQYLKQGGYNYQYWFLPKGNTKATLQRTEGSYWQTQNEYTIYVYHRAWGERYDKLVGYQSFLNN